MSATLLPSPCKRTTGRPSLPHRRPLYTLRKECDGRKTANNNHHSGFNPRTPCGVRPNMMRSNTISDQFQYTHSLRSATSGGRFPRGLGVVSIHALLAECDKTRGLSSSDGSSFNPRTPCGVRRRAKCLTESDYLVSIHALLTECDSLGMDDQIQGIGFNPRTPYGVRLVRPKRRRNRLSFQSTHSLRSATEPLSPGADQA